jgi:phosphohistidine swiveling domain-containing protein
MKIAGENSVGRVHTRLFDTSHPRRDWMADILPENNPLAEHMKPEAQERLAAVPPSERVLLLPHCLRDSQRCQADNTQHGLVCKGCSPDCAINRLRREALEMGYSGVCIAPGGTLVLEFLTQQKPQGIVAVACHKELEMGLEAVTKMGQEPDWEMPAAVIVPLSKDGCVDTEVDVERVLEVIRLQAEPEAMPDTLPVGTILTAELEPGEDKDATLWSRVWGDEYWSDLVSPLFYSIFSRMLSVNAIAGVLQVMGLSDIGERPLFKLYRGHVYFNASILRDIFEHVPQALRSDTLLSLFPPEEAEEARRAPFRRMRRLVGELRLYLLDRDGLIFRNYRRLEKYIPQLLTRLEELDKLDLGQASNEELLDYFSQTQQLGQTHLQLIRWGLVLHNMSLYHLLRYALQRWCDDDGTLLAKLLTSLPDNRTTEANRRLWELAQVALASPTVAAIFREAEPEAIFGHLSHSAEGQRFILRISHFLAAHGHRSVTRDVSSPTWEDNPGLVISLLKGYVTASTGFNLQAMEARQAHEREETTHQVLAMLSGPKRILFKILLDYTHRYMTFRENQRFYLDMIFLRWRRVFLEIGRRFREWELISVAEDVFFLRLDEILQVIRQGVDKALVAEWIAMRKEEYASYGQGLPPTFVRGSTGFEAFAIPQGSTRLHGLGVSPGYVTAPARVISDLAQSHLLEPGEILVAVNADPGWTPLFVTAGGVVLETGGMLSHGAIVSREYGIPAVTGVRHATRQLHSGQCITVDGKNGVVSWS